MHAYRYLIIGGGMTAASAIQGIRQQDADGSIGLISQETHPPYNRPWLSKGLWAGKPFEKVWRPLDGAALTLHLGRQVISLDPQARRVIDDQGAEFSYQKLLLATGGAPRRLPVGEGDILYFRTLDDYQKLRRWTQDRHRIAVIGGGFIGSEIAAALANEGQEVVMLFPEQGIGGMAFPADLSLFLNDYYGEKGVRVLPGESLSGLEKDGPASYTLHTSRGRQVRADFVVAGIGILPNTALAEAAGLQVENGILVDANLRTSQPDIYAAGDVANFYSPQLDRRLRVEHEDNALTMGRLAGHNMAASQPQAYNHLPYFYSDLFDLGYEAVGELNSRLETFADWQEPYRKGVVYYLDEGQVRGVLLWNVWDQVPAARQLIAEAGKLSQEDLRGRLPAERETASG